MLVPRILTKPDLPQTICIASLSAVVLLSASFAWYWPRRHSLREFAPADKELVQFLLSPHTIQKAKKLAAYGKYFACTDDEDENDLVSYEQSLAAIDFLLDTPGEPKSYIRSMILNEKSQTERKLGLTDLSERTLNRALAVLPEEECGASRVNLQERFAETMEKRHSYRQAIKLRESNVAIMQALSSRDSYYSTDLVNCLQTLAYSYAIDGSFEQAKITTEAQLKATAFVDGVKSLPYATGLLELAKTEIELDNNVIAAQHLTSAIQIFKVRSNGDKSNSQQSLLESQALLAQIHSLKKG